jgi:hypothetical protein
LTCVTVYSPQRKPDPEVCDQCALRLKVKHLTISKPSGIINKVGADSISPSPALNWLLGNGDRCRALPNPILAKQGFAPDSSQVPRLDPRSQEEITRKLREMDASGGPSCVISNALLCLCTCRCLRVLSLPFFFSHSSLFYVEVISLVSFLLFAWTSHSHLTFYSFLYHQ